MHHRTFVFKNLRNDIDLVNAYYKLVIEVEYWVMGSKNVFVVFMQSRSNEKKILIKSPHIMLFSQSIISTSTLTVSFYQFFIE